MQPSQEKEPEQVDHPAHYNQGKVECIDAIESMINPMDPKSAFLAGQVVKYVWRHPAKNGLEDLRKACWYLNRLINHVEAIENELSKFASQSTYATEVDPMATRENLKYRAKDHHGLGNR